MQTSETNYVGHKVDFEDAARDSHAVVVAEMLDHGKADPGPPGQTYYYDAKIRVISSTAVENTGEHTITFCAQKIPEQIAEKVPDVGEVSLFFLQRQPDNSLHAIKILPATEEHISHLQSLK